MTSFITPLDADLIRSEPENIWKLNKPFVIAHDDYGIIEVPAGFETDLASVPRFFFAYLIAGGKASKSAVVHDYLHCIDAVPDLSRREVDYVFLELMIVEGVAYWRRQLMWLMVRLFGGFVFKTRFVADTVLSEVARFRRFM